MQLIMQVAVKIPFVVLTLTAVLQQTASIKLSFGGLFRAGSSISRSTSSLSRASSAGVVLRGSSNSLSSLPLVPMSDIHLSAAVAAAASSRSFRKDLSPSFPKHTRDSSTLRRSFNPYSLIGTSNLIEIERRLSLLLDLESPLPENRNDSRIFGSSIDYSRGSFTGIRRGFSGASSSSFQNYGNDSIISGSSNSSSRDLFQKRVIQNFSDPSSHNRDGSSLLTRIFSSSSRGSSTEIVKGSSDSSSTPGNSIRNSAKSSSKNIIKESFGVSPSFTDYSTSIIIDGNEIIGETKTLPCASDLCNSMDDTLMLMQSQELFSSAPGSTFSIMTITISLTILLQLNI